MLEIVSKRAALRPSTENLDSDVSDRTKCDNNFVSNNSKSTAIVHYKALALLCLSHTFNLVLVLMEFLFFYACILFYASYCMHNQ
jgi:hypothetical protein